MGATIPIVVNLNTLQIVLRIAPRTDHLPPNLSLGFFRNHNDDRLKHRPPSLVYGVPGVGPPDQGAVAESGKGLRVGAPEGASAEMAVEG